MSDWSEIRKRFPVTERSVYLNTAAAGPLAVSTQMAATEYYHQMTNDGDVYWDNWLAKREEVRKQVARFINAEPDEVGLTTNTSNGMNLIVDALENHGEVISNDLEFPVSTIPWMHRRIPVHLVKSVNGVVTINDFRKAMDVRSGIISLSYVQFSNGLRSNLQEFGENKGNHALVVNASQAAGTFEIDVKRMKIDALCSTGHKWMLSGYGSGFVYIGRELQKASIPRTIGWLSVEDPYGVRNDEVHLRHDVSARAEMGCPHFGGIFALGASVEMMQEIGIKEIEKRALGLNSYLTERLQESGWKVLSPLSDESYRSAETLVEVSNPAQVVSELTKKKVLVTEKPEGIRVATDFFNNEDDVDQLIEALAPLH
jgi:cysteine desulfurase / selenocysteine lyase